MGAIEAFEKLNQRQREAAQSPANPLLIIAGAGTGKTNTLAHRVNTHPAGAGRKVRAGRRRTAAGDVGVISCRKTEIGLNSVR